MMRRLSTLGLAIGLAGPALAQTPPAPEALDWMRLRTGERIQQQPHLWSVEQVDAMLRPLFLAVSRDGTRITAEDRDIAARAGLARARPTAMTQFLRADISGAGRIDRDAMATATALGSQPPRAKDDPAVLAMVERYFRQADTDGDGIVTYREAVVAADQSLGQTSRANLTAVPAELDLDGDGAVGLDEFGAVLRVVFEEIDTDRDGRISRPEADHFRGAAMRQAQRAENERTSRRMAVERARRNAAECAVPSWPSDAVIVAAIGPRGNRSLADVTIGSGEAKIGAVNVHIEPGPQPLAVVLTAPEPTIWQFSGETGRVVSVFVAQDDERRFESRGQLAPLPSWEHRSGVTGLDRPRITFAPKPGCLPPAGPSNVEALEAALSRRPEAVAGGFGMTTARLPSGSALADGIFPNRIEFPTGGAGGPLWALAAERREAVIRVEPDSVVAARPVSRSTLPGLAGLATLVDDGRAKIAAWQTVTRFLDASGRQVGPTIPGDPDRARLGGFHGTPTVSRIPTEVMLLAPVAVPTGLQGSGIRRLILARGVPAPSGDRMICIIREDDGKPLPGSRCN
ncbi:EF-hand domain-containing protein [Enterovirga rhinocerotis]|uniref:EF hand domain-containing protein n=1 Tax=Enterovirga rhinocerotis TaxID=1339210 RepID=A0A4R7C7Q8_9HYPH|nr:EF-hand domain-containing protein [Enterovirga rhinocerotis]TDR94351.1 EF hand domain-containing protein [Enterovirga rhinocerotis]